MVQTNVVSNKTRITIFDVYKELIDKYLQLMMTIVVTLSISPVEHMHLLNQ